MMIANKMISRDSQGFLLINTPQEEDFLFRLQGKNKVIEQVRFSRNLQTSAQSRSSLYFSSQLRSRKNGTHVERIEIYKNK